MSSDTLTVGDLLLLRQLAAQSARAFIGDGKGFERRLDDVADARRRALRFVDPSVLRELQALSLDMRAANEEDLAALAERERELLGLPCGAPLPEVDAAQSTPMRHDAVVALPASTPPEPQPAEV